jgi:hypothetical protein
MRCQRPSYCGRRQRHLHRTSLAALFETCQRRVPGGKYLPILDENLVAEDSLGLLTSSALEQWGILAGVHRLDRLAILQAARRRNSHTSYRQQQ